LKLYYNWSKNSLVWKY